MKQKTWRDDRGFSMIQITIVMAVMTILSTFAILGLNKAKANLRLQNSVRQLSSYLEKARLDAIKRHGTSSVVFTDVGTYDVTMDFGSGVTTRTIPFESGVTVVSSSLPNVNFNWRGRTQACTVRFTVQNEPGEQSWVAVSDAGDVTVNSDVDSVPGSASYAAVNSTSDISSTAVVTGSGVHTNTVDCSGDASDAPPGPPIVGTGIGCADTANPSSISVRKSGGSTATITITPTNTGTITVQAPVNLQVTPATQPVTGGTAYNFSVHSINNARSTFAVNFNTPCTTLTVLITVTN
ncbi:MAG TPA: GspH/FimT family pseudopilin [Pyrinomonadaceae bacterium]|nr:GspH/FimT family pseudopilin [Pyrinomonadaceae bacterium]